MQQKLQEFKISWTPKIIITFFISINLVKEFHLDARRVTENPACNIFPWTLLQKHN